MMNISLKQIYNLPFKDTVKKYSGEEASIKRAINDCINRGL